MIHSLFLPDHANIVLWSFLLTLSWSMQAAAEVTESSAMVYRLEAESDQSLVIELLGDRTEDKRVFLIMSRPQFDKRFRGPEYVYSEDQSTGSLRFKVRWPTGIGDEGDRPALKERYEALGEVVSLNNVDNIKTAQLLFRLGEQQVHWPLDPLQSNMQIRIPSSQVQGLEPATFRAASRQPLKVNFFFMIEIDDARIPIIYEGEMPVSHRIISP